MKTPFDASLLPPGGVLITCSSHEERCESLVRSKGGWMPSHAAIFHYDDDNPKREERHARLVTAFSANGCRPTSLPFTEHDAARSLYQNIEVLRRQIKEAPDEPIIFDISVFTKRHLLMMLRWLDDQRLWDNLFIFYSEPGDYMVSEHIPLSFGISRIHQIPGLCAAPDSSRPLHLVIFLGYEGDRALAAYEHIQPMETTLVVPYPPYKPDWEGRTESFNKDLVGLVGTESVVRVDAVDPASTVEALVTRFGSPDQMSSHSKVVCPLGTKPQAVGLYMYIRTCLDPPAVVYASPLRHNHLFFSEGIGQTWFLKIPVQ